MSGRPSTGDLFRGRYRLLDDHERRGASAVFDAQDEVLGRRVTVKLLDPPPSAEHETAGPRFLREAKLRGTLASPHISALYEFGLTDDGDPFMILEHVDGPRLSAALRTEGAFGQKETVRLVAEALQALHVAHHAGVFHRNVTPQNLVLFQGTDGATHLKLVDFGLATLDPAHGDITRLTRDGLSVGTTRYMSPEQLRGAAVDGRSDLFSLGLVAFEMLTGQPANPDDFEILMARHLAGEPWRLPPGLVDPEYERVFHAMVAVDPDDRFASAGDALAALEAVEAFRAQPRPTTPPAPSPTSTGPNRVDEKLVRRIAVGSVALLALGFAIVLAVYLAPDPRRPDRTVVLEEPDAVDPPGVAAVAALQEGDAGAPAPSTSPSPVTAIDGGLAPGAEPASTTSLGCGEPTPFVGEKVLLTRYGGTNRSWRVYVPSSYDPHLPQPVLLTVVLDMLGFGSNDLFPQFDELAEKHGFILVSFSIEQGLTAPGIERRFIRKALHETSRLLCMDGARTSILGQGRAEQAIERLICQLPFAGHVRAGYRAPSPELECDSEHAIPRMHINGRRDGRFPLEGGRSCVGFDTISRDREIEVFRGRNGCLAESTPWVDLPTGKCDQWRCDTELVTCLVHGGRHWPRETWDKNPFDTCESEISKFPYPEMIWKFLSEYAVDGAIDFETLTGPSD